MTGTSATDVARAARLVAAISADDKPGVANVIREAQQDNSLVGVVLAMGARLVQIAGEYYDTDRQQILDIFAMDAMTYAENADDGQVQ
jgi:hypothetical protein